MKALRAVPPAEESRLIEFHRTTEEEKHAICGWKYDGEYAVYNLPPYEEQVKAHRGFANPGNRFYSCTDDGTLIGYINFIEKETQVFMGIGVHPRFCGQGYGQKMAEKACELSHQLYPGKPVCLEVRTWNTRAVRCYEKAGFHIDGEPVKRTALVGECTFFRMTED